MTFLRLGLFATAISLSSCVVTTAPEPADFKLSDQALSQKYRAARRTGAVRLYAQKIETTRDQWGRETHQATGGSLLVKDSNPPILAEASSISVTPEFSEAFGRSTVKRNDRLFIGQDESTTIRIDGTEVIPQGPVLIRGVAPDVVPPPAPVPAVETIEAAAPPPPEKEAEAPIITPPPLQVEVPQEKPKTVSKPKPKPRPKAPSPAKTRVATKPTPPAKTTPSPAKPATPPPAAKPKETPAPDTSRLLNLMREPTDR